MQETNASTQVRTRTIGRYRIVEQIGEGGMGEVFLAVDNTLGRRVALKFISRGRAQDPERIRRFRQEARAASALNHANIVTVYDLGDFEDGQYIASEFIDGETLRDHMAGKKMALDEAIEIVIQIASALSAAHGAGVVHRDIKPDNVMIRRDGVVKVVDFGLAKLTERPEEDAKTLEQTEEGVVLGTTRYMSPEQARGEILDGRTDIWSLGVVLFELITGQALFDGASRAQIIARVLTEDIDVRKVPPRLRPVVSRALARNRDDRYATADDLIADLRKLSVRGRRAFWLVPAAIVIAAAGTLVVTRERAKRVAAPIDHSVAVLPFANLSGDPKNDFLSDGTTDEIINSLARIGELKVVSRTSSFTFKGQSKDVREVADALGVASIVEGSVRKSGNRLRVTAQLVDARNGYELWSNTFDSDVSDVFNIQDQIAGAVASALRTRLLPRVQQPSDVDVYEQLVKARALLERQTPDAYRAALDVLRDVVRRDPQYADGWAQLADTYGFLDHLPGVATSIDDTRANHKAALDASNRALAIDPNCAQAHAAIGHVLTHDGDFAEAERRLEIALRLSPNSAQAHTWIAVLFSVTRRNVQAKEHILRARELDPLSAQVAVVGAGTLYAIGDLPAAEDFSSHHARLAPQNALPYFRMARIQALQGRRADAEANLAAGAKRAAEGADETRAFIAAAFGDRENARSILNRIGTRPEYEPPTIMAASAMAGDLDRAVARAEAFARENPSTARVMIDVPPVPAFAGLRADPRYRRVRQELGLPALP